MFILIPIILIFCSFAYLQLNNDISIYTEVFIYLFIALTIYISYYLAKVIKEDMKKQEANAILIEINKLKHKLTTLTDEKQNKASLERQGYQNKIDRLTKEYNSKVN